MDSGDKKVQEECRDIKRAELCPYDSRNCRACDDPHDIAPLCYVTQTTADRMDREKYNKEST